MKFGILLTSIYDATVDARVQRQEHEELVAPPRSSAST